MAYKQYISELDELTSSLAQKPQTIGFVHKFIVPGWIGFIQDCIIESKMSKVAKQPIHKGLNYYECSNKIIELTEKACEARKASEDFKGKDNDNLDNLVILNSSFRAIDAWSNVYPEIAYWMNMQTSSNQITCAYDIVQRRVKFAVSEIVDIPAERKTAKPKSSFGHDMEALGGRLAAMFCNIIVLMIIAALISAISG